MLQKYQWSLFWLMCIIIAVVLFVRMWVLLPIYMEEDLRYRTQSLIQTTAAREGWMLSGVSIKHVSKDALQVQYRSYKRGIDTVECYDIDVQTGFLSSCNAS